MSKCTGSCNSISNDRPLHAVPWNMRDVIEFSKFKRYA